MYLKEEEPSTAHRATGLLGQKTESKRECCPASQHIHIPIWVKSKERHLMEMRFEGAYLSPFTGVGRNGLKEEDW